MIDGAKQRRYPITRVARFPVSFFKTRSIRVCDVSLDIHSKNRASKFRSTVCSPSPAPRLGSVSECWWRIRFSRPVRQATAIALVSVGALAAVPLLVKMALERINRPESERGSRNRLRSIRGDSGYPSETDVY